MSTDRNEDHDRAKADTSRRTFLKATGATTAAVGAGANTVGADEGNREIKTLVQQMSLAEKVGQMTQVALGEDGEGLDPEEAFTTHDDVETIGDLFDEHYIGSILHGGSWGPTQDGTEFVSGLNDLQEYNVENTDHGVPFIWGGDALHGNCFLDGCTSFPQRLNMGATRDLERVEAAAMHTGESVAAMGGHWNFGPTADLLRDMRWGRFFEGHSEDAMLLGEMARVRARGFECHDRVAATVKHFSGYGTPNIGNDRAHVRTSLRDLRTRQLPPQERALEEAKTVMVNSGAVNGKPAHASEWLLTTVLREHYEFDGVILTDWDDFERKISNHEYVPDTEDGWRRAIKGGLEAGIDMCMCGAETPPTRFIDTTIELVEDGEIDEQRIDESVRRILELKRDIGLLEDPYTDESEIESLVGGAQDISEQLAKESLVLLENDDETLPLDGDEEVLLTGPGIDDGTENRFLMQHGGWTLGWQGVEEGAPTEDGPRPRQSTIAGELSDRLGNQLTHVPTAFEADPYGTVQEFENGRFDLTDEQSDAIIDAAETTDAAVVVLGEGPHNEGFGDRDRMRLPEAQQELVALLADELDDEVPLVGVILAGSPRGTDETFQHLDSILFAGQPGSDTGIAVADVLFGEYNPSGKLPFTWESNVGFTPLFYDDHPPRQSVGAEDGMVQYEFGHGLSYTDWEYSELSLSTSTVESPSAKPIVTAEVTVENTGDTDGEHIVEVYNTESYGSVLQPHRRLVGFDRVQVDSGGSETVTVELDLSTLEVVPGDVPGTEPKVVEAGEYELSVGDRTATLTIGQTEGISERRASPVSRPDESEKSATAANLLALFQQR